MFLSNYDIDFNLKKMFFYYLNERERYLTEFTKNLVHKDQKNYHHKGNKIPREDQKP